MLKHERLAARMIGIGFDGLSVTTEADALIQRGVRAVIFFARNVVGPQQIADLAGKVKMTAAEPILTAIDQEGGRVMRLKDGFTAIPSMRDLGGTGDERLAFDIGGVIARELRAVNIDQNLAPVLDVDTNPDNPVIGDRSLGRDAALVARMGVALANGSQAGGVAACAKHFPGHGDTSLDSHLELPTVPHPIQRLRDVEFVPFHAAARAGVACFMSSHVMYPAIDPKFPATLSEAILGGVLRERMGYQGVIMSDDMQMKAIAKNWGFDEAIVLGANAGIDLFWVCHSAELQNRAIEVLAKAIEAGKLTLARAKQSQARLDRVYARFVKPAAGGKISAQVGSEAHAAIVRRVTSGGAPSAADPTEQFVRKQMP